MAGKIFSSESAPSEALERPGELTADTVVASGEAQRKMGMLARQYEDICRSTPEMRGVDSGPEGTKPAPPPGLGLPPPPGAGDARTPEMEKIASEMRALARSSYPLVKHFIASPSAGERLAAVSILEEIPNSSHLTWLADRIATEEAFIGHHAVIALLNAARSLGSSHRGEVKEAIKRAQAHLDSLDWKDPNQVILLKHAQQELKKESSGK
jgi:hypothetical protein